MAALRGGPPCSSPKASRFSSRPRQAKLGRSHCECTSSAASMQEHGTGNVGDLSYQFLSGFIYSYTYMLISNATNCHLCTLTLPAHARCAARGTHRAGVAPPPRKQTSDAAEKGEGRRGRVHSDAVTAGLGFGWVSFPCTPLAHQILVWLRTNPPKCRGNLVG